MAPNIKKLVNKSKNNVFTTKNGILLFAGSMAAAAIFGIAVGRNNVSEVNAQSSASDIRSFDLNGINVNLDQDIKDNGDGTYSLNLLTSSYLNYKDHNVKNTEEKYGYFKANKDGKYLFEIYGGKGGDGEDSKYSKGGKGGDGAHLTATLSMKKGEYIFYTIGGNGEKTVSKSSGGGAGGTGGDHGDTGSYYVGGGGGYTAIYYFDENHKTEFESNYLSGNELIRVLPTEEDRTSKYVMIAGGGGGGGAGNAFSISDKAIRTPDGGSAGQLTSPSGELTAADTTVPGKYYSASNGYSSGKNQNYIGKGGSNIPGEVNATYLEWFNGKQPNDWLGTQNANYPGGSGGSGNLRGGAGGAGYAGGSGGVMSGLLIGTNIGGGGGGSSFISNKLDTTLQPLEEMFVINENESTTGGSVYISYVPEQSAYESLNGLTITGSISKYFDIVSGSGSTTHGTLTIDGNNFKIEGAKALPQTTGSTGTTTNLSLKVKPKDTFMGGNDVPVFDGNSIKYDYVKDSTQGTFDISLSDQVKYVNVPFNFELITNNYTGSCDGSTPYKEKKARDLFVDNKYTEKLGTEGFDFISDVTGYTVKDLNGNTYDLDDTLSVTKDTTYNVSFDVTPKSGSKAVVGTRHSKTTFTETATINIIDSTKQYLNGNEMSYSKTLNYNQNTNQYELSLDVSTSGKKQGADALFPFSSQGTGTYTVTSSGVYGLHAWGGDGGQGGKGKGAFGSSDPEGSPGGQGGYYEAKVYLEVGDVIKYSVGKNGSTGENSSSVLNCGGQGYGGVRSEVYVNDVKIIVAGGGGGGGGGSIKEQTGGNDCTSLDTGSDGQVSTSTPSSDSNTGAAAGTNYINKTAIEALNSGHDVSDENFPYKYTSEKYDATKNSGGAVYISSLDNSTLTNYNVSASFSSDFNLVKTSINRAKATMSDTNPEISKIVPDKNTVGDTIYINFKVTYTLEPNCDGGNDIKLLNNLTVSQTDCNDDTSDDSNAISSDPKTDYANVKINPSILNQYSLVTNSIDYIQGDTTGVNVSDLAEGSTTYSDPTGKLETIGVDESFAAIGSVIYPDESTEYLVSYGVGPSADPVNAVVGPQVEPLLLNGYAKINVYHKLDLNLSHLTVDDKTYKVGGEDIYIFTPGQDYVVDLIPEEGYDIPSSIIVKVDGNEVPGAVYYDEDNSKITISIDGDLLKNTSTISIEGQATEKEYKIHYVAALDKTGLFSNEFITSAVAGETGTAFEEKINSLIAQYDPDKAPKIDGYTYTLEYPDGSKPTVMPGYDIWINGVYNPNPHKLTVHYVDESGADLATTFVDDTTCYNTKSIDIKAEEIEGYAPSYVTFNHFDDPVQTSINPLNPKFTMPDKDLDVYIVYIATAGKVIINYTSKDQIELPEKVKVVSDAIATPYSIPSPKVEGYTPSVATVSGVITAEGESFTVNYEPDSYKITFDSDGGTEFKQERTVFYNHEIGYTGTSYEVATYEPLPVPVKVGYNFLGWYVGSSKIDENTVYTASTDLKLTAKWEKKTVSVTIHINSDDSALPFLDDVTISGQYGDDYSYTFKPIEGYTAPTTIDGVYGANNSVINVTYTLNHHDITVHYVDEDGNTLKADEVETNVAYGTSYNKPSTFDDDKYEYVSTIGTPSGLMPDNDVEITYVYKLKVTVVTEDNSEIIIKPTTGTEFVYGNEDNTPIITVKVNDVTLTENEDYTIEFIEPYDPNTAGEKEFIIHFINDYSGDLNESYIVKGKDISETASYTPIADQTYTGSEIKPGVEIKDGDYTLVEGTDYELTYKDNINKGTATITVEFIGNYSGTADKDVNFEIKSKVISNVGVYGVPSSKDYTGEPIEPVLEIKDGSNILVKDKDYVLIYLNNTNAGEATILIKFINNYEDTPDILRTFTINPVVMDPNLLDNSGFSPASYPFTGSPIEPNIPDITYDGTPLTPGVDFKYHYEDNTDVPEGKLIIEFINNYEGNPPYELKFPIEPKVVSDPKTELTYNPGIDPMEDKEYTGSPIEPKVEIKDGDYTLIEGKDYELQYENNTDVGDATMTIKFIGNYEGTDPLDVPFEIIGKDASSTVHIVSITEPTYTGGPVKPTLVIKDGSKTLVEGVDYEIICTDTEAGPATATVKFLNNYSRTKDMDVDFNILPMPIDSNKLTVGSFANQTYTGKELTPTTTVEYDGKGLTEGKDFEYTYVNNVNAGTATVFITFKGNYASNVTVKGSFIIIGCDASSSISVEGVPTSVPFTGEQIKPDIVVKDGTKELVENVDYVLAYGDNTNAGTGTITIIFINNYEKTPGILKTFEIKPVVIDPTKLGHEEIEEKPYTGDPIEPKPEITYDGKPLKENEDFIYKYEDNTDAPEGKLIIEFINNYEGNPPYEIPFEIKPKEIEDPGTELTFEPSINPFPDQPYNGGPIKPELIIKDGDKPLEEGKDYILTSEGEDVGPGELKIEFIGNYEGTDPLDIPFNIVPKDASDSVTIEPIDDVTYTGQPIVPEVVVKDGDKVLEEGKDYILHSDSVNVGKGKVTIEFIGNYAATEDKEATFNIVPKDAGDDINVIIEIPELPYTGDPIKPELNVKDGDKPLEEGKDYIVIYSDNTEPGTATATVIFIGNYADTDPVVTPFTIKDTSLDNRVDAYQAPGIILEYADGFDPDVKLVVDLIDKSDEKANDYSSLGGRFYVTSGTYDVKLMKDGAEIQPSDLGEDVVLTLRIKLPEGFEEGTPLKIVHAHSVDDISVITLGEKAGIGTYIIEGGYIVTLINKLSDFSVIYESKCISHWFLLAIAVIQLILLASLIILGKKPSKMLGIASTAWMIIMTAVAGAFSHCTACIILVSIDAALIIASVLFFTLYKGHEEEEKPKEVVYIQVPAKEAAKEEVKPAPVVEEVKEEAKEEVKPEPEVSEAPKEEEKADLSLKDSIAEAKLAENTLDINKKTVVEYLNKKYPDLVVTNTRENMTSTGLPLGDTHYMMVDGKKKCFIYVYEIEGSCFFIVRGNEEIAKAIRADKHKFINSAFPKTRDYAKWYTMLIDDSYESNKEVFDELDKVIAGLSGNSIEVKEEPVVAFEEAPKEEEKADLSLKDSIEEAKLNSSVLDVNKKVIVEYLNEKYPDLVVTNTRENMTSTGLPLGDTHYMMVDGKKKCFCYVYELEGTCFLIVRGNKDIVKDVKALNHNLIRSAFPKTRDYAEWYTLLIDDSYSSNEQVFEALDAVISGLNGGGAVPEAPKEEEKADLSLKDSINEAKVVGGEVVVNKEVIVKYLNENYADKVVTNTRENMTSTGLPLGDTHYMMVDGKKKCFCYVYDIEGNCFLIVRGDENIAGEMKALKHKFIQSSFPKTRDYAKWYTMLIDKSYKSMNDVYEALDLVIKNLSK